MLYEEIPKKEEEKPVKINMVEDNKNNIVFNNVKVNISFNVENSNKIICVDVNQNKLKFDVDHNKVIFPDKGKNEIHVQEKPKIDNSKKNSFNPPKQNNNIHPQQNNNNNNNKNINRGSIQDRVKFFSKK